MEISFSQSFLDNLERIDNKVVIDGFEVSRGDRKTSFQVVCHGKNMQVCVEGISGEYGGLDFYCGEEIGFSIRDERIAMNPERTIFEFNLPSEPKAIISCPWETEDTEFLEGIGPELGNSLYKDIPVSEGSLVWKETLGKYVVDRGIQDNHLYDVELLDTKSGVLEERPIRFKSYQGITIEQGNWEIEMIKKSAVVKHDVYDNISSASYLVWDSPMSDAKVNLSKDPECIDRLGEYVDPGNIVYGNTDCFQFTNYNSNLVGFRITGTVGSDVEVLFNRESSSGNFTSFRGTIGEDGMVEIRFSDLPYLHFNGIRAVGPSRVTGIETIMYLEEIIDEYSPNPDKTYVARLDNETCIIKINGVCDYIEYEKYLGEIKEIGRGSEHIDSVPGIMITQAEDGDGGLSYEIMDLEKQVEVKYNSGLDASIRYAIFQVKIDNNITVDGNIITTSLLTADYKIKIEQTGIIWKINNSPDYINGDDGYGIFLLGHEKDSERYIEIITNDSRASSENPEVHQEYNEEEEGREPIFEIKIVSRTESIIDGERWTVYSLYIKTLDANTGESWKPKKSGTENPYLVTFKFKNVLISSLSFYAIQLKNIENPISVWEETIIPGQFTKVDSKITLLNTITKNFIVTKTKNVESSDEDEEEENFGVNWYYYDLFGTNKFYITDQNFQTTNVGLEYLLSPETTILDLGTGKDRETVGRVINANRSDLIGSIGTLVVTESPAYPSSWRNLIDNNTVTVEVERVLDNIYIRVGRETLKNEDYEVEVDSICAFPITVNSNFKYIIQTYGYLRIYPEESFEDKSGDDLLKKIEVFKGYNDNINYTFALVELDEDKDMEDSYIEIRSGSLLRKITLKVVGPKKEHDYLLCYPKIDPETGDNVPVEKPNLIRIFENGTIADTNKIFLYTSTTTPKIEVKGINYYPGETEPLFYSTQDGGDFYGYHSSNVPISVPNSRSLSYSKYPIKSFGYIREMSQNYSDTEVISSTGLTSYIEYPLYMKGKEHFLWCVDNLSGLSNLKDPSGDDKREMTIDASGGTTETLYIVSRYDIYNGTFITEIPIKADYKISRDELEASIKILSQENIGLDEGSQIEYAIPIQVTSNAKNTGGNIFLGSVRFCAKTEILDSSINDVIEVDENIAGKENIDASYIKKYIVNDRTQYLDVMIYQLGLDPNVFKIMSTIPDLDIFESTHYVIPEVGSNYTITSMTPTLINKGSGENICRIKSSSFDSGYFLVEVESDNRLNPSDKHWFSADEMPTVKILDTKYQLNIEVDYNYNKEAKSITFARAFTKYGFNIGLYVEGEVGFGTSEEYVLRFISDVDKTFTGDAAFATISKDGGSISLHAGIIDARDGCGSTEALHVPENYEFIGPNKPISYSWVEGNVDSGGNLYVEIPPRARDDKGYKEYVLKVTQYNKYYPMSLFVVIAQEPSYGENPDTDKENYKIMFLDDEIDIWSDGTVVGTESKEYEVKFVHNLSKDVFENNVYFIWDYDESEENPEEPEEEDPDEEEFPYGRVNGKKNYVYLDDLSLEEIERSYEEGYVKFRFKPNGSRYFIDTNIVALMSRTGKRSIKIGKVKVKQGYYCLNAEYHHPDGEGEVRVQNHLSRKGPKELRLYKIGTPPKGYYEMVSTLPCRSNDDNSMASSSYCTSRGVLKLTAYRREYNENHEEECSMGDIFKSTEILNISPSTVFESYGLSYVSVSNYNDHDAKVDPRFNSGKEYKTTETFNSFVPYLEIAYTLKEEYVRDYTIFGVSCKITIAEFDTGKLCDYYFFLTNNCNKSDEPQNVNLLEFSDYSLKYDCKGGAKQVSFSPASFGSMMRLTMVGDDSWMTASLLSNSNYISFIADENISTDDDPAYYRTTQAKIEVTDSRTNPETIMKTFYFDLEQEPDIQQTSGSEGSGGSGGKVPSNIYVNVKLVNSTGKQVPITGEIKMYVGGHNGIFVNLPGASSSSTLMTLTEGEETLEYSVNCVGNGVDPSDYLDQYIDSSVIVYAPDGGSHNSEMITATISGNSGVFSNNASYTVTLNSYDPGSSGGDIKIDLMLVNNQTDPIYLNGLITFEVSDGDEGTVTITSNLPVAYPDSNIYSIPVSGSIGPYEVTCSGDNIENYLGNQLTGDCSVKYSAQGGGQGDSYYRPYTISGNGNIFEREAIYTITFEPKNRSLSKGVVDEEIIDEPIPVIEEDEKNKK